MARALDVYFNKHLTGVLTQNDYGEITFQYSSDWLNLPTALPLSQSLPLRNLAFTARESKPFFDGILPEADNRKKVAKNLGVSSKNYFALLDRIGGECAGAISFIDAGGNLPSGDVRYRSLTVHELAQLLKELPRHPLLAGDQGVRLSLAGAQVKIAVSRFDNKVTIPLDGAPTTHIVKPGILGFEETVFNELFCMRLARAIGLNAAEVEAGNAEDVDYLLIKRYDRAVAPPDDIVRLHQEDFCQALGIVSENKYQNEGGPSLQQCFNLVREVSSSKAIDLIHLLDCATFNFVIGNNDAHGKNFSLLYTGGIGSRIETRLAPFYDLLCTEVYPELTGKMAMKIGGEYQPRRVNIKHFERMAEEAGLGKTSVRRRVWDVCDKISAAIPVVATGRTIEDEISQIINSRREQLTWSV